MRAGGGGRNGSFVCVASLAQVLRELTASRADAAACSAGSDCQPFDRGPPTFVDTHTRTCLSKFGSSRSLLSSWFGAKSPASVLWLGWGLSQGRGDHSGASPFARASGAPIAPQPHDEPIVASSVSSGRCTD